MRQIRSAKTESLLGASRRQGRKSVGHPVDIASGTFFCAWNDIQIGGRTSLVLRRYFSTRLTNESLAQLGPGWTHNFALSLTEAPAGFSLRDQNGGVIKFPRSERTSAKPILNEAASMELRDEGETVCVYHWHDWKWTVEKLWFRRISAGSFALEKISPPSGLGLFLEYDQSGRLSNVTQMIERRRISFLYNERGLVSECLVGSPSSNARSVVTYSYDDRDRLVEASDATGSPIRYVYDRAGRMTREQNRSGAVFLMRYDKDGRCVETRGEDGYHACRLRYAPPGRVTLVTDSLANVRIYEFNDHGQVLRETGPNGAVVATRYDKLGRIIEEVGPLAGLTKYQYDEKSNVASVVYPSGATMAARYDEDHQPTLVQYGESVWQLGYRDGQLVSVTDPYGIESRYSYDVRGFLNSILEPSGNMVRILPDESWAWVRISDDYGLDREEHYNDVMDITQIREPDGGVFRFEFDILGRLVRAAHPGVAARVYRYDAGARLASVTDGEGNTTLLRHSRHGLLEQVTTPEGRTHEYRWDTEGRLKAWINPAGERAGFEHDSTGNEVEVRHFDGRVEKSEFDLAGRRTRLHRADGSTIVFVYDISNNLLRVRAGNTDLMVNEYDLGGRLLRTQTPDAEVSFEYNGNRIAAEIQNGKRVVYRYNELGEVAARGIAGAPLPVLEFEYDRRKRLVEVRRGPVDVQSFRFNGKDQVIERRFANCTEILEYDISASLVRQTVRSSNRAIAGRSWAYDQCRNVIQINDQHFGTKRYEFDGDQHLARSWTNGIATDYIYDLSGNLVGWEGGERRRTLEYLTGNRLTRSGERSYKRDENGNVTHIVEGQAAMALSWNPLGQLAEVRRPDGSKIKYGYDGLGRRIFRQSGSVRTDFVWAGEQLLAEVSPEGTTEYLFGGRAPLTMWRGTMMYHLVNSHLGVPLELLSEDGRLVWSERLDDWGNLKQVVGEADNGVAFRFPGQYADKESGLYYNRFRYYDPLAGQYLSTDPIGLAGGANLYAYCPNPVNWMDPFGLSCGIKAGQQSVYVLEQGPPPTPPTVIYVGITMQSPHDRLSQHMDDPPGGVTPDQMRIIATGPPQVPDRTSARLIEASILTNSPQPGQPGALNNAERPVNPGYYHSNVPSAAPPGTTLLPPSTTSGLLSPTNGTVIK